MTVRFLLDEHLSPVIAVELEKRGFDAVAVAARADLRTRADPDILEAAAAEGRILVTRNVGDFVRLDTAWASADRVHAGIVCLSGRRFPADASFVGAVVSALSTWADEHDHAQGHVTFL